MRVNLVIQYCTSTGQKMTASIFLFFVVTSAVFVTGTKFTEVPKFALHTSDLHPDVFRGDMMPLVGFGTSQIIGLKLIKEVLDNALAAGYRLFDTAQLYGNERDIGKALKELLPKYNLERRDIWITTKLAPENQGEKAYAALQESVKNLDLEYVDLYLIHWPGSSTDYATKEENAKLRDESWKQLIRGAKDGLTRNIGVSNYLVRHLKELLKNDHGVKPTVNQVEWHPHYHPQDLSDYCRKEGILLQAYSSLGGSDNPDLLKDPKVEEIAAKLGKTPAQILLRWAIQQNIAVIPKARSKRHIDENIQLNFTIPEADMKTLSNFSTNKYSWDPNDIM